MNQFIYIIIFNLISIFYSQQIGDVKTYSPESNVYEILLENGWVDDFQDKEVTKFRSSSNLRSRLEIIVHEICCGEIDINEQYFDKKNLFNKSTLTKINDYAVIKGEKNGRGNEFHWVFYYGNIEIWCVYFVPEDSQKKERKNIEMIIKSIKINKKTLAE